MLNGHDGYRLRKGENGWTFVEGRPDPKTFFLTRRDMHKIDACAKRRGIFPYFKYVTKYTELGGMLFF